MCSNDATWSPVRSTAEARSSYATAWQAAPINGASYTFPTAASGVLGNYPSDQFAKGTSSGILLYHPDLPMVGNSNTNLTCVWWWFNNPTL